MSETWRLRSLRRWAPLAHALCAGLALLVASSAAGAGSRGEAERPETPAFVPATPRSTSWPLRLAGAVRGFSSRWRASVQSRREAVTTVLAEPLARDLERAQFYGSYAGAYLVDTTTRTFEGLDGIVARLGRRSKRERWRALQSVADLNRVASLHTDPTGPAREYVVEIPKGRRVVDPEGVLEGSQVEARSYDPKTRRLTIVTKDVGQVLPKLTLAPSALRQVMRYLGGWYIPRKDALSLDYWRHRIPQISAASLGAAIGIYAGQAADQAKVASFTNLQQAVDAGMSGAEALAEAKKGIAAAAFITGAAVPVATKVIDLLFSRYLAPLGDRNPKRMFLLSTLLAGGTSIGTTAAMLHWADHFGLVTVVGAMAGALAGAVGLGVGVNIFNHLAQDEHARGEVNARNHNQDQAAFILGVSVVLGLSQLLSPYVAAALGIDSQTVALTGLGALMLCSSFWAARGLRMEQLTRKELRKLVDGQLAGQGVAAARWQTSREVLAGLFREPPQGEFSSRTVFTSSLSEALGSHDRPQDTDRLRSLFAGGDYLLRLSSDDRVVVGLKSEAPFWGALRALMHARLVEHALDGPLFSALQRGYGDQSRLAVVELAARALPDTAGDERAYRQAGWNSNPRAIGIDRLPPGTDWRTDRPVALSTAVLDQYFEMVKHPDRHQQTIAEALSAYPAGPSQRGQGNDVLPLPPAEAPIGAGPLQGAAGQGADGPDDL